MNGKESRKHRKERLKRERRNGLSGMNEDVSEEEKSRISKNTTDENVYRELIQSINGQTTGNAEQVRILKTSNAVQIVLAILTFFAVFASAMQAFYSRQSIESAERSTKVAEDATAFTKRQFEIESRPYLVLASLKPIAFAAAIKPKIGYAIKNIGRYPVKMVKQRSTFYSDTAAFNREDLLKVKLPEQQIDNANGYVFEDLMFYSEATGNYETSQFEINQIQRGVRKRYWISEFLYKNLGSETIRRYKIIVQFTAPEYIQVLYEMNDDIE